MSAVLIDNLRASDLAARWGGEELAILLANTSCKGGYRFADRLRLAIMAMVIDLDGERLCITASFGVAEAPIPNPSLEALLSKADTTA